MQNYYQILGLVNFAPPGEIKKAFRRLAKLYHPDINPIGQEHFKSIVKAYETLSDSYQKSQYDYKLKVQLNQNNRALTEPQKKASTRARDVTEQELKRRRYYQENYKDQYKKRPDANVEVPKTYNEFKNILIATPLAVLLIMVLLNVWHDKPKITVVPYKEEVKKIKMDNAVKKKRVVTGNEPYKEYFGGSVFDTIAKRTFTVKNLTGNDLIIFLFNKDEFIRSCYIEHNYEVTLDLLPKELSSIRIMGGEDFQYIKELTKAGVYGAFTKDCKFYYYKKTLKLNGSNQMTLDNILDQGFEEGTEDNFFKKELVEEI